MKWLFKFHDRNIKDINTLNGVHMWVFFNTERLNMRATHFKTYTYGSLDVETMKWENRISMLYQ